MKKLIIIRARTTNGGIKEYRTIGFTVKPFHDGQGLYLQLDDGYTFVCKSIEIEQREIEPAIAIAINSFGITEKDYNEAGIEAPRS